MIAVRERGQAIGLLVIAVTLIMATVAGIARLSIGMAQRSRAQNAADAAALAGAVGGYAEAFRAAEHNGSHLVSYTRVGQAGADTFTVTVQSGDQSASARVSNQP
jgi:Flp pilus assembly protein TadG